MDLSTGRFLLNMSFNRPGWSCPSYATLVVDVGGPSHVAFDLQLWDKVCVHARACGQPHAREPHLTVARPHSRAVAAGDAHGRISLVLIPTKAADMGG